MKSFREVVKSKGPVELVFHLRHDVSTPVRQGDDAAPDVDDDFHSTDETSELEEAEAF